MLNTNKQIKKVNLFGEVESLLQQFGQTNEMKCKCDYYNLFVQFLSGTVE